jgi:hypothetical protein
MFRLRQISKAIYYYLYDRTVAKLTKEPYWDSMTCPRGAFSDYIFLVEQEDADT